MGGDESIVVTTASALMDALNLIAGSDFGYTVKWVGSSEEELPADVRDCLEARFYSLRRVIPLAVAMMRVSSPEACMAVSKAVVVGLPSCDVSVAAATGDVKAQTQQIQSMALEVGWSILSLLATVSRVTGQDASDLVRICGKSAAPRKSTPAT